MGSWQHAGRMLRGLRENRGWEVPKLAAELKAKATAIGQAVPDRQSLVRMIYEWEAGTHRPRAYYMLFVLVYATEEELATRTIKRGSELHRLMAALKAMGVPVNRRQFLLNAAALAGGVAGLPTVAVNLDGQERLTWVLKHPRSVDLPTVAYLRTRTFDLMKQYEAVASPPRYSLKRPSGWSRSRWFVSRPPLASSNRSCGGLRRSRPRCWAGSPGTCPANRTTRLPPATTTRPSPPPATSRKAGSRRSPGCSSASCPSIPAAGTPTTGYTLPSWQRHAPPMAPVTLLPAGRRPLPPRHMHWLVRSARPDCSWSAPTSIYRRSRPTTPCSGSLAENSWAGSSVPASFACTTPRVPRQPSRTPPGAWVRARRSTRR